MKRTISRYPRILALAPSTRGIGFAVLEGLDTLADWGVKTVTGDKNKASVVKAKELILHYRPEVLVLEDSSAKDSRRSLRIRKLTKEMVAVARKCNVSAVLFSRKRVRRAFFGDGQGTKHALAQIIAQKYPEELSFRLPPKRQPWKSEDCRMDIFDAVALALMVR